MNLTGRLAVVGALTAMSVGGALAVDTTPRSAHETPAASAEAHVDLNPFRPHPHCTFAVGSTHQHRVMPGVYHTHRITGKGQGRVYYRIYVPGPGDMDSSGSCR